MNNPLTPVEALQREIDCAKNWLAAHGSTSEISDLTRRYIAALKLAKADAEFDQDNDSPVKYKALIDSRVKLYEALQK